jgi:Protein of unknown function (DUF3047)
MTPGGEDMPRSCWPCATAFLCIVLVGLGTGRAVPPAFVLRFADTLATQDASRQTASAVLPVSEPEAPAVSANSWLMHNGWKQIWPLRLLGAGTPLFFAGPPTQRYLRLSANDDYYIWTRQSDIDPHAYPVLDLTWGIERFPQGAALDVNDRTDRPLVVLVSFGPKVPSLGLLPSVPRGLAFFWGETETVGALYTCITPKNGPADVRLQCRYPHVKYIALRRGAAGSVHTDQVNLLEHFQQQFPEYWQQYQRVPPVVAVSFEVRSDRTHTVTSARLYSISFRAQPAASAQ